MRRGLAVAIVVGGLLAGASGPEQIALDTTQLVVVSTPHVLGTATTMVTSSPGGNDQLVFAAVTGADAALFSFPGLACAQPTCDLSSAPLALPAGLAVGCTPASTATSNATLTVKGASGSVATALVRCDGAGNGGPVIQLSTPAISIPDPVPVGMSSAPIPLTLTNAGAGTLTATIAVAAPADAEWKVSDCTAQSPCSLVGHGTAKTVEVTLVPAQHGDRTGVLSVTTNDPDNHVVPVNLFGTGRGGFLEVISPSLPLDFGAIPSVQSSEIAVALLDSGNAPLSIGIAPPSSPFSADVATLDIAANEGGAFFARCGPGAAIDGDGDFVLTSDAYNAPMLPVHASCKLVDSDVTIMPTRFGLGELRVGTPAVEQTFTITNVTTHDVSVDALAIANAPDVLALVAPPTPHTLHASEAITGKLLLTPTADVAFDRGVTLGVTAGSAQLALPISGRVVTPHAQVTPIQLDLGTACVGSTVSGVVHLTNDGTATLAMTEPTVDEAFVPHFLSPVLYPSSLLAATQALVEVVPAATTAGSVHGILTWPVDVPSGAFKVPIDLDYIDAGTAVSPKRYDFDTIAAKAASDRRTITIENCGTEPIDVAVAEVDASEGDASAWDVQPRGVHRTLLAEGTMKLLVRFAPQKPGSYRATIPIVAGSQTSGVDLAGDATGPSPPTDFYACTCASSRRPLGAWPIALAVVTALGTRRSRRRRPRG